MDETYMTRKRFLSRSEAIFQRFHDDEPVTKGMKIRSPNPIPTLTLPLKGRENITQLIH